MQASVRKHRHHDWCFEIVTYAIMVFVIIVTLYPFLNMVAISLNDTLDASLGGIGLIPRKFTLSNYRIILDNKEIYSAFVMSVLRTVVGTVSALFCTALLGYILAQDHFVLRKFTTMMIVFTMYVSAGLIPGYFMKKLLGLINSFWVYIIPNLCGSFHVILIRTYLKGIPNSVYESARLDGAKEFTVFSRIIVPMAKPVLATVALYIAVNQWNSWFDTYMFASGNKALNTLQFELMKMVQSSASANANSSSAVNTVKGTLSPLSIRATITVVTAIPILMVYPFLQKYFVAGMNIGSVKE